MRGAEVELDDVRASLLPGLGGPDDPARVSEEFPDRGGKLQLIGLGILQAGHRPLDRRVGVASVSRPDLLAESDDRVPELVAGPAIDLRPRLDGALEVPQESGLRALVGQTRRPRSCRCGRPSRRPAPPPTSARSDSRRWYSPSCTNRLRGAGILRACRCPCSRPTDRRRAGTSPGHSGWRRRTDGCRPER